MALLQFFKEVCLVVYFIVVVLVFGGLLGCSSGAGRWGDPAKRVIETSYRESAKPDWLLDTRVSWDDGDSRVVRGTYVIQGSQRVNGCFDLARAETKEALLTELANDVKGEFVRASQGLAEALDENVTKSWVESFQGDTRGLRFTGQAYERFIVNDVERVECFVLGRIRQSDYTAIKNRIQSNAMRSDDRIRKAMEERQSRFLNSDSQERSPQRGPFAPTLDQ